MSPRRLLRRKVVAVTAAVVAATNLGTDDPSAARARGAAYPITIDPLIYTEQAELTASDAAAGDLFGGSVAIEGDTAVIGALGDNSTKGKDAGAVYVFVHNGSDWSQQAKLTASDGAAGDFFGGQVALSGDTIVVGARGRDTVAGVNAGAAYIFVRDGAAWRQQAVLTASDGSAYGNFGSVDVSGDTAVVGAAPLAANDPNGAAYIYVRTGTTWSEQAKLTASGGAALDNFGGSVAVSGETAVIGSTNERTVPGEGADAAYVFVRSGTAWSEQARLTGSGGEDFTGFGGSVALSGDTALVGAKVEATVAGDQAGAAYVFVRSGSAWSEQARLTASDGAAFDNFGSAVDVAADTAIVGAPEVNTGAGTPELEFDVGAGYLFERDGATWSEVDRLAASDGDDSDSFGSALALSGNTAIVGAGGHHSFGIKGSGAAYVFTPSGTSPTRAMSIGDVSMTEGDSARRTARFTVTLSQPAAETVTVLAFTTSIGTAQAPADYVARIATLSFAPGQTAANFDVGIKGDNLVEPDETFQVGLDQPHGAAIADGTAVGTILNDD